MINVSAYIRSFLILALAGTLVQSCAGKSKKGKGGGGGEAGEVLDQDDDNSDPSGLPNDPNGIDPIVAFEPDQGIKTGRQIYNTYLTVTGITPSQQLIDLYNELEAALPVSNRMISFDAGKQSAIVKLAVQVCHEMVDTQAAAFFPGVNVAALDANGKASVAKTLIDKFWGKDLDNGIDVAGAQADIVGLIDSLTSGGATPANAVKGACSSVAAAFPTILL